MTGFERAGWPAASHFKRPPTRSKSRSGRTKSTRVEPRSRTMRIWSLWPTFYAFLRIFCLSGIRTLILSEFPLMYPGQVLQGVPNLKGAVILASFQPLIIPETDSELVRSRLLRQPSHLSGGSQVFPHGQHPKNSANRSLLYCPFVSSSISRIV